MNRFLKLIICLTMLTSIAVIVQAQAPQLGAQCETLKSEGEPDDSVKKNLESLKDKDAKVREQAARQLAASCDKRAAEALLALLADSEPKVRLAVIETLGKLGARSAIDPMLETLRNETDWNVRYVYADALASFQIYRASYAVLNTLANPQGGKVQDAAEMRARCRAILLVNQLRDVNFSRKAVGILFEFLNHDKVELRQIAEQTMMALRDTRNGKHELVGILRQNRFPEFQLKAISWIGKLGLVEARDALVEMNQESLDPRVQKALKETIELLEKKLAAEKQ